MTWTRLAIAETIRALRHNPCWCTCKPCRKQQHCGSTACRGGNVRAAQSRHLDLGYSCSPQTWAAYGDTP